MNALVLTGSRRKWAVYTAISAGFVAIGVWMLIDASGFDRWMGGLTVLFFGLGVLIGALSVASPQRLVLTPDRFTYHGLLGRTFSVERDDVEVFHSWSNPAAGQRLVAWRFKPDRGPRSSLLSDAVGAEAAIPGGWRVSTEALLTAMEQWRISGDVPGDLS